MEDAGPESGVDFDQLGFAFAVPAEIELRDAVPIGRLRQLGRCFHERTRVHGLAHGARAGFTGKRRDVAIGHAGLDLAGAREQRHAKIFAVDALLHERRRLEAQRFGVSEQCFFVLQAGDAAPARAIDRLHDGGKFKLGDERLEVFQRLGLPRARNGEPVALGHVREPVLGVDHVDALDRWRRDLDGWLKTLAVARDQGDVAKHRHQHVGASIVRRVLAHGLFEVAQELLGIGLPRRDGERLLHVLGEGKHRHADIVAADHLDPALGQRARNHEGHQAAAVSKDHASRVHARWKARGAAGGSANRNRRLSIYLSWRISPPMLLRAPLTATTTTTS